MKFLLKVASYLFHPLWMPFIGTLLYFAITPRYFPEEIVRAKIMAIAIMTLFIPIVFYFLLKTLGQARSYFLEDVQERRWPLLFYAAINLVVIEFVIDVFDYPELYYYFLGIFFSAIFGLVLVLFRIKISLHMLGLGGLLMFLIALSINYNLNLIYTISFFLAVIGLTATSRLHFKAHSMTELILGFLIGVLPQLLVLNYWL